MSHRVLFVLALAFSLLLPRGDPAVRAEQRIVQTDMSGAEMVPPVQTVAYGFVRFYFDDSRQKVEYTVDVKGLSANLVTGADIRRGPRGSNGPVVKHLADGDFIVTSGRMQLSKAELQEMAAGDWYVTVSTARHPDGEMRGQIVLPPDLLPAATQPAPSTPAPADTSPPQQPTPPQQLPILAPSQSVAPAAEAPRAEVRILPPSTGDAGLR